MLDKQGYMHARSRAHARTRAHAHNYVTLTAFSRQKWLRERVSVLRYTYIACLV